MKGKEKEIRIRIISADICSLFEEMLDRFDFTIPSDDRTGDEDEARIYGDQYSELEESVTEILSNFAKRLKENPMIIINTDEY